MILFSTTRSAPFQYTVALVVKLLLKSRRISVELQKHKRTLIIIAYSLCHTFLLVTNKNEQKQWWNTTGTLSIGFNHSSWTSVACLSLKPCFMAFAPTSVSIYDQCSGSTVKPRCFWYMGLNWGETNIFREPQLSVLHLKK